jgi:hypothetical protein
MLQIKLASSKCVSAVMQSFQSALPRVNDQLNVNRTNALPWLDLGDWVHLHAGYPSTIISEPWVVVFEGSRYDGLACARGETRRV